MLLARRAYPVNRFDSFRRDMDRLFKEIEGGLSDWSPFGMRAFPPLNIWDDGHALHAEAELPGFKLDDVEITVMGKELTIKGKRHVAAGEKTTYHRRERMTGEFSRTVTLPVDIDSGKVEAALKDGVLTIVLPKAETARARKIEVKSA